MNGAIIRHTVFRKKTPKFFLIFLKKTHGIIYLFGFWLNIATDQCQILYSKNTVRAGRVQFATNKQTTKLQILQYLISIFFVIWYDQIPFTTFIAEVNPSQNSFKSLENYVMITDPNQLLCKDFLTFYLILTNVAIAIF